MADDVSRPQDADEWLRRARSNLVRARADQLDGVYLEDLCFDAQQAAEKAIKAVLIDRGVAFPFVHDLVALLTKLQEDGLDVPEDVREAGRLNRFAVAARYPGTTESVTQSDYEVAVRIAEAVVRWSTAQVGEGTN